MSLLQERAKTHGDYARVARLSQNLKLLIRSEDHHLSYEQLESLEMICVKIARIVSGNSNEPDHWRDISGYAELIYNKKRACHREPDEEPPDADDLCSPVSGAVVHGG